MDDKTNLYIFKKSEVFLIFVFMLLIAITSFVIGVKVGGKYAYQKAGYTESDRQSIDMRSHKEESADILLEEKKDAKAPSKSDINKETEKMLQKEFEGEFSKENEKFNSNKNIEKKELKKEFKEESKEAVEENSPSATNSPKRSEDKLSGKYTIQLSSHQSVKDAEDFANGFKVRGYNPIINEVQIPGRGTWFRVSLGVFDSISDAKEYVLGEKSLFAGTDYTYVQFD